MIASYWIPGQFPSWNETKRGLKAGADPLPTAVMLAAQEIKHAGVTRFAEPVRVFIEHYWPDRRRDPDGAGIARLVVMNALQRAGVLRGDGWRDLATPEPFRESWFLVRDDPRAVGTLVYLATDGELPL